MPFTPSQDALNTFATTLTQRFGTKPFTRKQASRALGFKPSTLANYFGAMSRAGLLTLAGSRGRFALYTVTTKRSKTTKTAKPAGPAVILQLTLDGSTGAVQGTAVSGSDYKAAQEAVGVARKRMQELETENAELRQKLAAVTKALALV